MGIEMEVHTFESDAVRIAQQRIEKRDLKLSPSPRLMRMNKWHKYLMKAHIGFCFSILITGYFLPSVAKLLAALVSPLAGIITTLIPIAGQHQFTGPLGDFFYWSFGGEIRFFTVVTFLNYLVFLGGQYWKSPARLSEFALEQFSIRRTVVTAFFFSIVTAFLAFIFAFVLALWFGFAGPGTMDGPIKVHQIVLWGIIMPGSGIVIPPLFLASLSGVCLIWRRLTGQ